MIAAITFFPQASDQVYPVSPDRIRDFSQKMDANALKLYLYIKGYGTSGHRLFPFNPQEVMRALQMSRRALGKAISVLENVLGFNFGPIEDWQVELPEEEQFSPAPTPSTSKLAQRVAATESSPPAPAAPPPPN